MSASLKKRVRLFLDANVLISASWKHDSKVHRLWRIPSAELVTSEYVLGECRRNLPAPEQQDRLSQLLLQVRVIDLPESRILEAESLLPVKDQPVLAAAVLSQSDFLVTGDRKHFGTWYGQSLLGMRVEPPARFPEVLDEP